MIQSIPKPGYGYVRPICFATLPRSTDRSTEPQGAGLGKGGIDIVPSDERSAPEAPSHLQFQPETNPDRFPQDKNIDSATGQTTEKPKLLPRETGHDIGMGSPVPLSSEAVGVITRLRNMKVCRFFIHVPDRN